MIRCNKMLIQHDTNVSDLKKELKNAIPLYYGKSADGQEIVEMDSADIGYLQVLPKSINDLSVIPEVKENLEIIEANRGLTFTTSKEAKHWATLLRP
jgi:hypothetical protein